MISVLKVCLQLVAVRSACKQEPVDPTEATVNPSACKQEPMDPTEATGNPVLASDVKPVVSSGSSTTVKRSNSSDSTTPKRNDRRSASSTPVEQNAETSIPAANIAPAEQSTPNASSLSQLLTALRSIEHLFPSTISRKDVYKRMTQEAMLKTFWTSQWSEDQRLMALKIINSPYFKEACLKAIARLQRETGFTYDPRPQHQPNTPLEFLTAIFASYIEASASRSTSDGLAHLRHFLHLTVTPSETEEGIHTKEEILVGYATPIAMSETWRGAFLPAILIRLEDLNIKESCRIGLSPLAEERIKAAREYFIGPQGSLIDTIGYAFEILSFSLTLRNLAAGNVVDSKPASHYFISTCRMAALFNCRTKRVLQHALDIIEKVRASRIPTHAEFWNLRQLHAEQISKIEKEIFDPINESLFKLFSETVVPSLDEGEKKTIEALRSVLPARDPEYKFAVFSAGFTRPRSMLKTWADIKKPWLEIFYYGGVQHPETPLALSCMAAVTAMIWVHDAILTALAICSGQETDQIANKTISEALGNILFMQYDHTRLLGLVEMFRMIHGVDL